MTASGNVCVCLCLGIEQQAPCDFVRLWKVVELKTDAELGLKLQEDHHRITEAEIKKDCRFDSLQQCHIIAHNGDFGGSTRLKDGEEGSRSGRTLRH